MRSKEEMDKRLQQCRYEHICKAPYQPQAGNGDLKVTLLVFVCSFIFLSVISRLSGSAKIAKHKENATHTSFPLLKTTKSESSTFSIGVFDVI